MLTTWSRELRVDALSALMVVIIGGYRTAGGGLFRSDTSRSAWLKVLPPAASGHSMAF